MGSPHCNPELNQFMEDEGYHAFQFRQWNNILMDKLEEQQIMLMQQGKPRQVLILIDDISFTNPKDKNKLSHLAIRGRHFNVSLMMMSVAYSIFHKSCRRAADLIFLFSSGCQSDKELLLDEFAKNKNTTGYFLDEITKEPYTCCVLDLNEKQQSIYKYKADYCTTRTTQEVCTPDQEKTYRIEHTDQTAKCDGENEGDACEMSEQVQTDCSAD